MAPPFARGTERVIPSIPMVEPLTPRVTAIAAMGRSFWAAVQ